MTRNTINMLSEINKLIDMLTKELDPNEDFFLIQMLNEKKSEVKKTFNLNHFLTDHEIKYARSRLMIKVRNILPDRNTEKAFKIIDHTEIQDIIMLKALLYKVDRKIHNIEGVHKKYNNYSF